MCANAHMHPFAKILFNLIEALKLVRIILEK